MLLSRSLRVYLICIVAILIPLSFFAHSYRDDIRKGVNENVEKFWDKKPPGHPGKNGHDRWLYKDKDTEEVQNTIVDNFPLAASGNVPPVPSWNQPPKKHVPENTPLFIGFTRNWRLLQQAVVSYITAGWPPEDIYVVDNSGVMRSNEEALLSLQNPFYLDYYRLNTTLGVNVIRTPTLLSFAQLQNFFLSHAVEQGWDSYFWSHMDVVALSWEDKKPYKSFYDRVVEKTREALTEEYLKEHNWSAHWFAYDRLVLVRTQAYLDVGGWDTFISYYMSDCDMHERLRMAGFEMIDVGVGELHDVGSGINDLLSLYRRTHIHDEPFTGTDYPDELELNDESFEALREKLNKMVAHKNNKKEGRNYWQSKQTGGEGDPFYRFGPGFEEAIQLRIEQGREMFRQKWGYRDCDLIKVGLRPDDPWKVKPDF